MPDPQSRSSSGGRFAALVAAGILLSRVFGVVRESVFAHYFGNSDAADAFRAAFRIPNFLQNLFGEGVLSASFIPVYAGLLARGDSKEADRVAGAIFSLLALVVSALVCVGVLATPLLIDLIAPGFEGEKRDLAITLVRILFPGAGILVQSAWCLGILNSHRRFFLSYAAPVLWNVVMIGTLVIWGARLDQPGLATALAWGSVVGSLAQFAIQLPTVIRYAPTLRPNLATGQEGVRTVVRSFVPVFVGRGVVQISAYMDAFIASLLPTGAVAAISYAQTLYLLPVSLFGMSVSAAELPVLSSASGSQEEVAIWLRQRLDSGLRRIAFFVVPSAVAFLTLGDVVAGAIYETGRFGRSDSLYVWAILAGATVGLLAGTLGRLYASTFYALKDTRTPLRCALARVAAGSALGYGLALYGPAVLGWEARWGAAGITLGSGVAAWLEFTLLRAFLNRRIGPTGLPTRLLASLWGAALLGAAAAWALRWALGPVHPLLLASVAFPAFGLVYLGLAVALKIPETGAVVGRLKRIRGRLSR